MSVPITFDTYLVRPLPLGGSGRVSAAVSVTNDTLKRVVAKIGLSPSPAWDDPNSMLVEVPIGSSPGTGEILSSSFMKAPASDAVVVSFFAELSTDGWVAGPVVSGVDLSPKAEALFPWLKPTVIDMLKQFAVDSPPDLQEERQLAIKSAFPRDAFALPALSVQVSAIPTGIQLVGDSGTAESVVGGKVSKVRGYSVTVDLISWTDNPEEREVLAPWIGGALTAIVETIPFFGAHEPTFSVNESEDFDALKIPAFLVTGTLNFTAFSEFNYPVPTSYGHLTLKQEAP